MDKQSQRFADRFSKVKIKCLILFWAIGAALVIRFTWPTIVACYSIFKAQTSYYAIAIKDERVEYTRQENIPAVWVPLSSISKRIQGAIISSEDGKFYLHPGYDLEQLRDAIDGSFVKKKKMRGASTITQQLVKNLFLSQDRTFLRKAKELVMALMIEKHADKKKILETYLNVIEYGQNIYGIGAATKYYFNKRPNQVTAREAAFLAMLLPSPKKYAKSFKAKTLTSFAARMVASILLKMQQGGYISMDEYNEQLNSHMSWERPSAIALSDQGKDLNNDSEEEALVEQNEEE